MEKIYTIDDIYEIYKNEITEANKIKSKKLFHFEKEELLKERKKIMTIIQKNHCHRMWFCFILMNY